MMKETRNIAAMLVSIILTSSCVRHTSTPMQDQAVSPEGFVMTHRATGPFDVTLKPQDDKQSAGDTAIARMLLDKQYHGDLEAVGKGQMLGVRTAVNGSAGYVAMEQVSGTLAGRQGSFTLQHSSTMNKGKPQQSITVVPDSGTDQLAGLVGSMTINIVDGKHAYDFKYGFDEIANP